MEEEQQHSNHSTSSNSQRLQIRRNILRQTSTLRSSPYNSTLSNLRRRQTSLIASQTINNLLTNIENNDRSSIEQEDIQSDNSLLVTSDDENENFHVLVDFSNANQEQNPSYHSLSTIDFDPDDDEDDDDDDDHRYYYTSTSILDYSSSSPEPLIIHNNPRDIREDEYSPSINNNSNDDEDLSIEIILETSQNNSLSPIPRRRRSIISSNIRNNRGLPLSEVLNIPQKLYNSLEKSHQTQCHICLEDFQSTDLIKILNCQHIFHA
jgi:hypothetical protein